MLQTSFPHVKAYLRRINGLDLAFRGLREGLSQAIEEKGQRNEFDEFSMLVDQAYDHYLAGRRKEGFLTLDQAHKILKKVRTS